MDAMAITDGSFVIMKSVKSPSDKLDIAVWFSAEPQQSDPANHCVPILEVFKHPNEAGWAIIIMLFAVTTSPALIRLGKRSPFSNRSFR
jgi:hypothetical protein